MKRHTSYLDSLVAFSVTEEIHGQAVDMGPMISISPTNPNHGLQLGDILQIGIQRKDKLGIFDGGKWEITEQDIKFWNQTINRDQKIN